MLSDLNFEIFLEREKTIILTFLIRNDIKLSLDFLIPNWYHVDSRNN